MNTMMTNSFWLSFLWKTTSILVVVISSVAALNVPVQNVTFALINGPTTTAATTATTSLEYYKAVKLGWEHQCTALNISQCLYYEHDYSDSTQRCQEIVLNVIENKTLGSQELDGMAVYCQHVDADLEQAARNAEISMVYFGEDPYTFLEDQTFDDTLDSTTTSSTYIGTDQRFMGRTMARLLKQLHSASGGTYSVIQPPAYSHISNQRRRGFELEIQKLNRRDDQSPFVPLLTQVPRALQNDPLLVMEHIITAGPSPPTAFILTYPLPMHHANWTHFVDRHRHLDITYICTDISQTQLDYLNRRYVHGLVGQMPYEMGTRSVERLLELADKESSSSMTSTTKFIATNLVQYNLIPIELPEVQLDKNLIGNLVYVGYTCFGVLVTLTLGAIGWTIYYRNQAVVKAAQPFFLLIMAVGIIILAMTLIPLTMDDGGDPDSLTERQATVICMSIPWLAFCGFTVTFSALFSKTWRVNQMFHSKTPFGRVQIHIRHVLLPFGILLSCNIMILIFWTVRDPLIYKRQLGTGTDFWNREFESFGSCTSNNVTPYAVSLGLINFGVLLNACWQAFQARNIESEFSEATYIAVAVFCMFQAFSTGVPLVVLSRNVPEAFYLVLTLLITILCLVVLLLIFLPKFISQYKYSQLTDAEQRRRILMSVRKSSVKDSSAVLDALDHSTMFQPRQPPPLSSHPPSASANAPRRGSRRSSLRNSLVRTRRPSGANAEAFENTIQNNQGSAFMALPNQACIPEVSNESSEEKTRTSLRDNKPFLSSTGADAGSRDSSTDDSHNDNNDSSAFASVGADASLTTPQDFTSHTSSTAGGGSGDSSGEVNRDAADASKIVE